MSNPGMFLENIIFVVLCTRLTTLGKVFLNEEEIKKLYKTITFEFYT